MNKVIFTGNLARDPEVRYTQSGKAVATFSLAVNRSWKKANDSSQPNTDFFNIVAWDKTAEFCSKYLAKGTRILLEGRLQTRTYEAQDGSKRYVTEVVANEIEFAGAKRQNGVEEGYHNESSPPKSSTDSNSYSSNDDRYSGNKDFDDIPF